MKHIIAVAAVVAALVVAPTAVAGDSGGTTTAPPATTTPATPTPVTETPVTTTPATTVVPATQVPATTVVPVTQVSATTVTEVPTTTTLPSTTTIPTTGAEVPCVTNCIPSADTCVGAADCIPTAGGAFATPTVGAGTLPFTGIGDMVAPILLALTVVLGGVVAWRWAQLREAVAQAANRARPLPAREARSGYAAAMRSHDIEARARQVFTPRVA